MKKTFTKHILLLALMLFGVAGAAWADRAPQKFTGPVAFNSIVQGDTLAPGFELTGISATDNLYFDGGRYSFNGTPQADPVSATIGTANSLSYPDGNIILIYGQATFTLAPMVDMTTAGNAWVVTDAIHSTDGSEIHLSGISITPDPTVPALDELTGNWNFLMPGSNKVVKVTYKAEPALAWTFGNRAIPNDTTITAYRGFELPVIGGIGAIMDHDFLTALLGGTVSLRYGSTNPAVISFTDANDMQSFSVNGAGECDVYMVFDGDDDFQYDSVAFHAVIANPYTLTLAKEGNGTVSALLGGGSATWTTETWANLPTDQNLSPLTFGDITISTTGSMAINSSYNPGKLSFFVSQFDDAKTLTFSSEGGNFSRIEMTMISEYSQYNPSIIPADGWTFDGYTAVWEGDAPSVTVTSCSTYVSQITFTRASDSIVATATEGQYLVIPGATVQVVATAVDGAHVSAWSSINRTPENLLSDTATLTVGETMTLTATFAQNPLLTLSGNEGGSVEMGGLGGTTLTLISYSNTDLPDYQTVSREEARALCGTDITSGTAYVFYRNEGTNYFGIQFQNGVEQELDIAVGDISYFVSDPYDEGLKLYYTTGHSLEGVTATETENQYLVLPGTQLSVTATPDSAHYLSAIGNEAVISNSAYNYSFTMPGDDTELAATFTTKPTLTLAQTDGGTLEAIVPQGGVTAMHPTTDQIPTWDGNTEYAMAADLQQFGFVAVDSAAAAAWTGVPASGDIILVYALAGNQFKAILFQDGQWHGTYTSNFYKGEIYAYTNSDIIYFTTGASKSNVIASSTPNTYYIDYGTPVTVKATPDSVHYLVSFSDDDPATERNSNLAVEKTYDSVIADIPNLSANFQAKPTLTLTANDGGTLTLDGITTELDQMMAHLSDPIAPGTQFSAFLQSDGVLKDNVKTLTDAQAIALAQRIAQTTGNNNILVVASTFEFIGDKYLSYGKPDGNNEGGTATMTNSNAIRTIYYVNTFDLLPETYPTGVAAGTTANTYRVDYGTTLTVTATPDATHYLATLGGVTMGSNTAKDTTFAMTAPVDLAATFAQKPTLTLAHNDGGTLEAIVPQGVGEETLLTTVTATSQTTSSQSPDGIVTVTLNNIERYYADWGWTFNGSVTVEAAQGYTITRCVFKQDHNLVDDQAPFTASIGFDGDDYYVSAATSTGVVTVGDYGISSIEVYGYQNVAPNVIASSTPNTYYVDYNTSVTVKATPSDTAYLVRFDQDADTNSNTAVEKTYGPLTAALTTAEATFNDKPVLTLAQNESWGSVTVPIGLVATDPTPAPTPTAVANPVITGVLMPDGSMQVTMSCTTQDADIYYTTDNVTSPTCDCPAAPEYTHPITFTEPVTIKAAAYTGNDWSAVVTKTITLGLPAGIMANTDGTYRVDYGAEVTVKAETDALHHVSGWTNENGTAMTVATYSDYLVSEPDSAFPATSVLTFTMTGDTTATAQFGRNRFVVNWSSNDESMGHVVGPYDNHTTGDPIPSLSGTYGTKFRLTAVPAEHYMLDHWSDGDTSLVTTVTITRDSDIVAYFKHVPYNVNLVSADTTMGVVSDTTLVEWNDSIEISATANYGYHFVQWNDGNTENPRMVTVNEEHDYSYTAQFAKNQYSLRVSSNNAIMGRATGGARVDYLSEVQISATANEHYHFVRWQDGNTENPRTVKVTGDMAYIAFFAADSYTVTGLADQGQGSVTGSGSYAYLSTATLTAAPVCGFVFDHWSNQSTETTINVQVTGPMTLTAYFRPAVVDTVVVRDTTTVEVEVPVYVHDTTTVTVHDTTTVEVPVYVHDTTTVTVHDTTTVEVPVYVHDTTTVTVHDTTTVEVPVYVHDTTTVTVHDTTTVEVPVYVHDTTTVTVEVPVYVHDTTTVTVEVPVYVHDTTIVEVPVYDTITLYDTVYIHDTIVVGVDEVELTNMKVYLSNNQIVVEGAEDDEVSLFDVNGRLLATRRDPYMPVRFDVRASGSYMVRIGNRVTRKVVVIR